MEFVISEPNIYNRPPHWFAGNSRYETMTDVKFVDDTTLVTANRMATVLYLVEFNLPNKSFTILDTIKTVYDGGMTFGPFGYKKSPQVPKFPDLLTVKDQIVYIAYLDNTIGIVRIHNKKFVEKRIRVLKNTGFYHGITIHPSQNSIVYLSSAMTSPKLVIADLSSGHTQDIILPGFKGKPLRQTRFIDETHIISVCGDSLISASDHNKVYDSYIGVFIVPSFVCLDTLKFPKTHSDDICVNNGIIYITGQSADGPKVFKYTFDGSKLQKIGEIEVEMFPHGIDVRNGILAVTSYAKSSVQLIAV